MGYYTQFEDHNNPGRTAHLFEDVANENFGVDFGTRPADEAGIKRTLAPDPGSFSDKELLFWAFTHSHDDHAGAAPMLCRERPEIPYFATRTCFEAMKVKFDDALGIQKNEARRFGFAPLYSKEDKDRFLKAVTVVEYPRWIRNKHLPGWAIGFYGNGHIPGSAMILVKSPEKNILITGDCGNGEPLVSGALLPPDSFLKEENFFEDAKEKGGLVVVSEGTNGNREVANQKEEKKKLHALAREVGVDGGILLTTAFSEARAAVVALNLLEGSPDWTVHIDGLSREFLRFYMRQESVWSDNAEDFERPERLRRLVDEGRIVFMKDANHREAFLNGGCCGGGPRILVSSSADISRGCSALYSSEVLSDKNSVVAFTGHVFPGSANDLALKTARGRTFEFGHLRSRLFARVVSLDFSAHDGKSRLADRVVAPGVTSVAILHHGSDEALASLKQEVEGRSNPPRVEIPRNLRKVRI